MPTPHSGENESDFISRCMGDAEARRTFPDEDQRVAFCYSVWRRERKNEITMQKNNERNRD